MSRGVDKVGCGSHNIISSLTWLHSAAVPRPDRRQETRPLINCWWLLVRMQLQMQPRLIIVAKTANADKRTSCSGKWLKASAHSCFGNQISCLFALDVRVRERHMDGDWRLVRLLVPNIVGPSFMLPGIEGGHQSAGQTIRLNGQDRAGRQSVCINLKIYIYRILMAD